MPATLDARTLRDAMSRYVDALRRHREEIDSLNVYPVPDGDTGTNMLLTQEAVEEALKGLDGAALPELAEAISQAALLGARGNSGVILSQVLRGMCSRLREHESPDAADLAAALADAADEARRAVANPVEGTMLSVLRDAAEGAATALAEGRSCEEVAVAALTAASASLERTKEQLPVLAEAGVVDAGGKGIVLLLDALAVALQGETELSTRIGEHGPVGSGTAPGPGKMADHGYEVMYLLECDDEAVTRLRERLGEMGNSLVVVGGGGLYNVHVHVEDPGPAVEVGIDAGRPRQIRITDLSDQVEACLAEEARGVRVTEREATSTPREVSLLAVAEGDGFAEVFRSLGAAVVEGGPGRNPSVADLERAIGELPGNVVFLLANHANIVPAAEAASVGSAKTVEVLPTSSMAHGVAVAAALSDAATAAENLLRLRSRLEASASIVMVRAARGAGTPAVVEGDWIAIAPLPEERILSTGPEPAPVAVEAARAVLSSASFELLTLYAGEGVTEEGAEMVASSLRAALPELEIDVQRGGQTQPYLIGLE